MKKTKIVVGGILMLSIFFYLISGSLLTYTKPLKSPYVLLEDWISPSVLEVASSYIIENNIDSVFIVGLKHTNSSADIKEINKNKKLKKNTENIYALDLGGILGFEIPTDKLKGSFTISIKMHGTSFENIFPYYRVYFNEQRINSGFVNDQDTVYQFIVSNRTIDSTAFILIEFDNDLSNSKENRNFYISEITIDTTSIESIMSDNFFISYRGKSTGSFISQLNNIEYYLSDRGYDTSKVKFIEINDYSFNKTLAYAKGTQNYFSNTALKNIDIITVFKHSRRSYLNFKNCLEKNMDVGCIPVNTVVEEKTPFLAGIDERISLVYTLMYWWFN